MNNVLRKERNTLISLSQIENGQELLNKLNELQAIINRIDLSKYRLKDQYITENDLDPSIVKDIFNDVINSVLKKSGSIQTLDDILLDIQNIKIILETCKKYNEPLSDGEIEILSQSIIKDFSKIITSKLEEERSYYEERLQELTDYVEQSVSKVVENNEEMFFQIGNMEDLHPFLIEALGPNKTVTDAINFLFQMLIDTRSYGESLPNDISKQQYPSLYEGERIEYGEFPEIFDMPNELGKVGKNIESENIDKLEDNDFGSISERIIYRKTLKKINKED